MFVCLYVCMYVCVCGVVLHHSFLVSPLILPSGASLLNYFIQEFGPTSSEAFLTAQVRPGMRVWSLSLPSFPPLFLFLAAPATPLLASSFMRKSNLTSCQRNFVESLAASSLFCYFVQVKDRFARAFAVNSMRISV